MRVVQFPLLPPMLDKRHFKEKGDPGFSPERNKSVIEESIKKYEATRARKKAEYADQVMERADAVASFLKNIDKGKMTGMNSEDQALKYFGKKELAKLRGQKILGILENGVMKLQEV